LPDSAPVADNDYAGISLGASRLFRKSQSIGKVARSVGTVNLRDGRGQLRAVG